MLYPSRDELEKLRAALDYLVQYQAGGIKQWRAAVDEFFSKYHEYIFDILFGNLDYTEPTQEAELETMDQIADRIMKRRSFIDIK